MKIAIYSRKSKFTGKGESIDNQIQLCKEYAASNYRNEELVFLEYEDEGYSGGNTNRPHFQGMMDDAKQRKFDTLICYRLDRISRNVSDFSTTLDTLQDYSIEFVSISEHFDTSTPMGRAMIYIASVFAQLERETIAERVRDNMLELSKTGRWLGGIVPIGYNSQPISYIDAEMNERKLVKLKQVPEELKVVADLFDAYLKLGSLSKAETYALQNNIKTKRGSDFAKASLRWVLTNPVYAKATPAMVDFLEKQGMTCYGDPDGEHGMLTYNKSKPHTTETGKTARVSREKSEWIAAVSSHKGIIEAEDWINVQKQLAANKDKYPNEGKTNNALLTGRLRCACCGSNMNVHHGHISAKTGCKIYYYACAMKKYSKSSRCSNKNAKVAELDAVVITYLKNLYKNTQQIIDGLKRNQIPNRQFELASKKDIITKSITEKEKQIDNLLNKLSLDDDLTDLLLGKIKSLKNELTELRISSDAITDSQAAAIDDEMEVSFVEAILKKCENIDKQTHDEQKMIIDSLLSKVLWDGSTGKAKIVFVGGIDEEDIQLKKSQFGNERTGIFDQTATFLKVFNSESVDMFDTLYKDMPANSVAEKIIKQRCLINLDRESFARELGVHIDTVEGWELSNIFPNFENMQKISNFFGKPPAYFHDYYNILFDYPGKKIRTWKDKKKYSYTDMMHMLGISQSGIARIVNGHNKLSFEMYQKLKALHVF